MVKLIVYVCLLWILSLSLKPFNKTTPYQFPNLNHFPQMPVSVSNPVSIEGVKLGRYLFYDPILSRDSNMSCGSCHIHYAAFSDSPNARSKGSKDSILLRNTMPLFNLAWSTSFFWDGRASSIEEQISHPLLALNEMNIDWEQTIQKLNKSSMYSTLRQNAFQTSAFDSVQIVHAIAQFIRTIISYQSKYDRVLLGKELFTQDELDGFELVNDQTKGDCMHCHITDGNVLGTNFTFSNNGLDSDSILFLKKDKGRGLYTGVLTDYGKFKVPSLRNLVFTSPYMHDGRFKTLEEVVDFYSEGVQYSSTLDSKMEYVHQGGVRLNRLEKSKIITFLKTLSDSVFIQNPSLKNPFEQ